MAKTFTDDNFQSDVIEASKSKPVLVDFYASWCGPCIMQGPIIEKFAENIGEKAHVGKLSTEDSQATAIKYGVMSIPTLMVFRNGEPVKVMVGLQNEMQLQSAIDSQI